MSHTDLTDKKTLFQEGYFSEQQYKKAKWMGSKNRETGLEMFIWMSSCTSLQGAACFPCRTINYLCEHSCFMGSRDPWTLPLIQMPRACPAEVISCFLDKKKILSSFALHGLGHGHDHSNQTWSYNLETYSSNSATHWGPPGSLFCCVPACCFFYIYIYI